MPIRTQFSDEYGERYYEDTDRVRDEEWADEQEFIREKLREVSGRYMARRETWALRLLLNHPSEWEAFEYYFADQMWLDVNTDGESSVELLGLLKAAEKKFIEQATEFFADRSTRGDRRTGAYYYNIWTEAGLRVADPETGYAIPGSEVPTGYNRWLGSRRERDR